MKAIAVAQSLPTDHPECFQAIELDDPQPHGRDLLVKVKAVAVNPVDCKVRSAIKGTLSSPKVLGWDVTGEVVAVGQKTSLFRVGDEVYYAGSIIRPGGNSEYHLVDERIVGRKPLNLSFAEAAALPLTSITAWEALFTRLAIVPNKTDANRQSTILIINGAGGVGSIAIQLAKQVAGLQVIATASREETRAWCQELGADYCLDHRQSLARGLQRIGMDQVDYILNLYDTDLYWQTMAEIIKPEGKICCVVGNRQPLDLNLLKSKSATFVWEFMFTKSQYQTPDMEEQGKLLNRVAQLIEAGILKTTLKENLRGLNPGNLAIAHSKLESGKTIGKLVLTWD